jgi:gas vesicle protein
VTLGAIAAGIAIGMLTAPSEGRKTRRRLGKRLAGLAESPASRLAALGGAGRRAGRSVRDRLDDLSEGISRRARDWRDDGEEALEDLQERIEALEARLEELGEDAGEDIEHEIDEVVQTFDSHRGSRFRRALGFALGAGLTYFLVSDRTATARARVQDAANKARRRATDEWDRFQRQGGMQRFKDGVNGTERRESGSGAGMGESPQAL